MTSVTDCYRVWRVSLKGRKQPVPTEESAGFRRFILRFAASRLRAASASPNSLPHYPSPSRHFVRLYPSPIAHSDAY
jgi:hypothetical protein